MRTTVWPVMGLVLAACVDTSDLEARVSALEQDNAQLRADLDAVDLSGYAKTADLADYAKLSDLDAYALTTDLADYATLDDLDGYTPLGDAPTLIDTTMTINVPADYATLAEALASLDTYRLAPGAYVYIQLADGTYTLTSTVVFAHPESDQIIVQGNESDPSAVKLDYKGQTGVALGAGGHHTAHVYNLTLRGDDHSTSIGVLAGDGGVVQLESVTVQDFSYGAFVIGHGFLSAHNCTALSNGTGFYAQDGSVIDAIFATVQDNDRGFSASTGSTINASSATFSGNNSDSSPALEPQSDPGSYVYFN